MDISILQQFLQLSRSQKMTETADFFNISQSTLSKNISRLEDDLGVRLFDRVGRHLELNHNGSVYAEYIGQSLELMEHGRQHLQKNRYEMTGSIRILYRAFADILTDCICEYKRLNPMVEFYLCESEARIDEQDFILCSYSNGSSFSSRNQTWVMENLYTESNYVLVSPAAPFLEGKEPACLADLKEAPFVSVMINDLFFRDTTEYLCQKAGFTPRIPFRTDKFVIKAGLVKNGMCAAFFPESNLRVVEPFIGPVYRIGNEEDEDWKRTVAVLHKKPAQMTEVALDFMDFLLDYYRNKGSDSTAL